MREAQKQSREEWLLSCLDCLQKIFEKRFNRFMDAHRQMMWLKSAECESLCQKMGKLQQQLEKESCCV